jgi:hypothetical protein
LSNDLKLSDCPARRDGCAGEGGGAAGVTRGAVRSSAWCVPSMGTVQMGFKSPVYKPEIMKMNTKIPAEVKELRVIAALKEDYAKPVCR